MLVPEVERPARRFGDELRRLRRTAGLSQRAVADGVGVQRATVAQWEGGRFMPAEEKLGLLGSILGSGETLSTLAHSVREEGAKPVRRAAGLSQVALTSVLDRVGDRLVGGVITDGNSVGWSHSIGSGTHPSPWSTAIGARTLLLLDRVDVDLQRVALTLGGRQRAGGWSNRALEVPRPDVTAVVLATLSRIGDGGAHLEDSWQWLQLSLRSADRHLPFVLCTVLEHLSPIRPDSQLVTDLVNLLLAARVDFGGFRAWAADPTPGPSRVEPSVAHTARAVVALRSAIAHADSPEVQNSLSEGAAFLAANDNDDGVTEILRIDPENRALDVPVDHFTAAHVVRALVGSSVRNERMASALEKLWSAYVPDEGLWAWKHDGRLATWMTYDAVTSLRAAAFSSFPSPFERESGARVDRTDGGTSPSPSPSAGR